MAWKKIYVGHLIMQFSTFLVFFWVVYATKAREVNFVIADCECVPKNNCTDANPIRCGVSGLVCCKKNSSGTAAPPVEVSSTTLHPVRSNTQASLFGSGIAKELTSQCGVATTQYNYELKEHLSFEYAIENEFPWVLEIFKKEGKVLFPECGAVLSDYRVAITTAHCVADLKKEDIIVRAGDYDIQQQDERFKHQDSKVLKIIRHPQYDPLGSHNNIALLMLEGFKKAPNINRICLPESGDFSFDSRCFSAGWGSTDPDEIDPDGQQKMQKIRLKLISGEQCTKKLRFTQLGQEFELSNSSLCASSEDDSRDTGIGFGGSPLFCWVQKGPEQKKHFSLLGITSWRVKDSSDAPGVYTAFPPFLDWAENASMDFFTDSTRS